MSNPLLDGFDLLTHGEAADGFVSVSVRALRDLVALARASSAGLEAGRADARQGVPKTVDGMVARLAAWEPVVRAAIKWESDLDGTARDYALSKSVLNLIAKAPEHRPAPAAGGGR